MDEIMGVADVLIVMVTHCATCDISAINLIYLFHVPIWASTQRVHLNMVLVVPLNLTIPDFHSI